MSENDMTRRKFLIAGIGAISGVIAVGVGGPALTSIGAPAVTNRREGKWVEAATAADPTPGQFNQ